MLLPNPVTARWDVREYPRPFFAVDSVDSVDSFDSPSYEACIASVTPHLHRGFTRHFPLSRVTPKRHSTTSAYVVSPHLGTPGLPPHFGRNMAIFPGDFNKGTKDRIS